MKRRTFLQYLAGAGLGLGITGLGVTISTLKKPETIDGKFYGLEGQIPLTSIMDEVYYKKPNYIYVLGETHGIIGVTIDLEAGELNQHTLERIFHLIQRNKIDIVSLEGLEGKITAETLKEIEEDKQRIVQFERMSKKREEYLVFNHFALSESEFFSILNDNRAFLGYSPGAYIAPALLGKVDAFGYEEMEIYQKNMEGKFYDKLLFIRDMFENEQERIEIGLQRKIPNKIFANREFLIGLINQQIELLNRSGNLLLSEEYKPFNSLINENVNRLVVNRRSQIAVRNTITYMDENGYTSSILVAGSAHLPTIKDALKQMGFKPYKLIDYQ